MDKNSSYISLSGAVTFFTRLVDGSSLAFQLTTQMLKGLSAQIAALPAGASEIWPIRAEQRVRVPEVGPRKSRPGTDLARRDQPNCRKAVRLWNEAGPWMQQRNESVAVPFGSGPNTSDSPGIDSVFLLVILAGLRNRQLRGGTLPRLRNTVSTALSSSAQANEPTASHFQ